MSAPSLPPLPEDLRRIVRRCRRLQRIRLAASLLCVGGATTTILLGASLALDRHLFLSPPARVGLTLATTISAVASLLAAAVIPRVARRTELQTVLLLERARPALGGRLRTIYEVLGDGASPARTSADLASALLEQTGELIGDLPPNKLCGPWNGKRLLVLAAVAIGAVGAIGLAGGQTTAALLRRFVRPTALLPRPSSVELRLEPARAVVGRGEDLEIIATPVRGQPERARLIWRRRGQAWQVARMEPTGDPDPSAGSARGAFRHVLSRLDRPVEMRVEAGDYRGALVVVDVRSPPEPRHFEVTYHPPPYTGLNARTERHPEGEIQGVAGTRADVMLLADRRLGSAAIQVEGDDMEPRPLLVNGERAVFSVTLRRTTAYRIHLEDRDGISNHGGERIAIHVRPDTPPEVRLLEPRRHEVTVESGRPLALRYEVRDDFGVESVAMWLQTPEASERELPLPAPPEPGTAFASTHLWDTSAAELRRGERAAFRIVVRDRLGQTARSAEGILAIALLPSPPEAPGWEASLAAIQVDLERALLEWRQVFREAVDSTGDTYPPDPSLAEQFTRMADDVLRQTEEWLRTAELCESTADTILIPSVHQEGLHALAARLRLASSTTGRGAWTRLLEAAAAIRASAGADAHAVPATPLRAAVQAVEGQIEGLVARLTALHRSERLETVRDTLRALSDLEGQLALRLGGGPADARTDGTRTRAQRVQRAIVAEAEPLGPGLLQLASLGGSVDRRLESLGQILVDTTLPVVRRALEGLDESVDGSMTIHRLERAEAALQDRAHSSAREQERWRRETLTAWQELEPEASPVAGIEALVSLEDQLIAALAALQESAAGGPAARSVDPPPADHWASLLVADRTLLQGADRLVERLSRELRLAAGRSPPDFAGARDLELLVSVLVSHLDSRRAECSTRLEAVGSRPTRKVQGVGDADASIAGDVPSLLARLRGSKQRLERLAGALERLWPAVVVGSAARRLDGVAASLDGQCAVLETLDAARRRALDRVARAGQELDDVVLRVSRDLSGLADELGEAEPVAAGIDHAARLAAGAGTRVVAMMDASRRAEPEPAGRSAAAAIEALEETARELDTLRSDGLPGASEARDWLRAEAGSLAERVRLAARDETALGEALRAATRGETSPPVSVPALRKRQDSIRRRTSAVAGSAALEAGRLSGAVSRPDATGSDLIATLDRCSERLHGLARRELNEVLRILQRVSGETTSQGRSSLLEEASRRALAAARTLGDIARDIQRVELASTLDRLGEILEPATSSPEDRPPVSSLTTEAIEREARTLAEAVARALAHVRRRELPPLLRADLISLLERAASDLRKALAAARRGAAEEARTRLAGGRARLREALERVRGAGRDTASEIATELEPEGGGGASAHQRQAPDLGAIHRELARLREIRDWQKELESRLDALLGNPEEVPSGALAELADLQRKIAGAMGESLPAGEKLVEAIASLEPLADEARRLGAAERSLIPALRAVDPSGAATGDLLRARLSGIETGAARHTADAEAVFGSLRVTGARLSMQLPGLLPAFWEADAQRGPTLAAMRKVVDALESLDRTTVTVALQRAASELATTAGLIDRLRTRAVEELASRESLPPGDLRARDGAARAVKGLEDAASELSRGQLSAARSRQRSSSRALSMQLADLRGYLRQLRESPGEEGGLRSGLLDRVSAARTGLSWTVPTRLSERDPLAELEAGESSSNLEFPEGFPEMYRDLARIYLRALRSRP